MNHRERVLAAVDNSAAAGPVLATAIAFAELYGADVEAMYVREGADGTARATAERAGIRLRTFTGDPLATILSAAQEDDVVALVLGTRGLPGGKRPAGSVCVNVMTQLKKPLVLVPPNASPAPHICRVLVPLDGARGPTPALAGIVERARSRGVEVVVLHVREASTVPRFSDQPQYETEAWGDEFLARRSPVPPRDVHLETRIGSPSEQIVRVAGDADCHLLALSWAQVFRPDRALVVHRAIEESGVPILLVPA